ncbi:MAG: ribonuclease HII [Dehalococcoidia bacterium]|jgi:ribonuclease HII
MKTKPRSANYTPSFAEEQALVERGCRLIAGIDEVGRGPLAGPVMAAAVILPLDLDTEWLHLVNDSKQLTAEKREELFPLICESAIAFGIGEVSAEVIDKHGIARATKMAMKAAIANLEIKPDALLIDFVRLPEINLPQRCIIKGDCKSISIACASIVAKVTRDRLMVEMDKEYPGYGFAGHKGYATKEHLKSIERLGACPIHRMCFSPFRLELDLENT